MKAINQILTTIGNVYFYNKQELKCLMIARYLNTNTTQDYSYYLQTISLLLQAHNKTVCCNTLTHTRTHY